MFPDALRRKLADDRQAACLIVARAVLYRAGHSGPFDDSWGDSHPGVLPLARYIMDRETDDAIVKAYRKAIA